MSNVRLKIAENSKRSNAWEVEVSGSHHVVGVWMMSAYREQMLIIIYEYNLYHRWNETEIQDMKEYHTN